MTLETLHTISDWSLLIMIWWLYYKYVKANEKIYQLEEELVKKKEG